MELVVENRGQDTRDLYLDLLARSLTADLYDESAWKTIDVAKSDGGVVRYVRNAVLRGLSKRGLALVRRDTYDADSSATGRRWPLFGYSMMGLARLRNVRDCVETVLREGIPGDLIETGVWRGGGCIYMAAVLRAHAETERKVWVADSFEGLPKPDGASELIEDDMSENRYLKVSLEQVRSNFARFGLLDEKQIKFLKGWFKDTIPSAPIERLSVLRLDGDLYESTMDVLRPLYAKVSPGGFIIVDDYYSWPGCRKAVDEFRASNGIHGELTKIDWTGAYWRK